jgi:HD-GYP domain-containing protein (c-di-GMP phosphodiesterase class II)/HAMP domain-containing protein
LITLAVLLISRVTRPLRRIAHAADQLRTGKREGALPVIPGDDEVARLAGSLQELVASLLQQEQHLAAANARLEHELEARTFAELEARRQAARANTLAHIAARLNARLELPAVLEAVCEETISALGTDAAVVRLYNSDTDQLELAAVLGMPDAYPAHVPTVPRSLYASVLNHPDVVFTVDDIRASAHPYHNEVREWNMWSSLTVPLRRGDQLLGVLNSLTVEAPATITDDTRTLLRSIADHATQAIGNAWSYDQAQRRLAHIQALRAIDTAITSSHDLPAILMTCVRQVTQQLGVDAALVLRYDAANQWLIWGAGEGLRAPSGASRAGPVAHTIAQRVIHERRRLSHADVSASRRDPRFARWLTQEGFVVYYGVPLIANGAVQGVLEVLHRSSLAPDQEWFEFLDTLAGQVAIAMAHVGLFANLSEANDALVHAYDTTIAGWSRALDLRDKETEGHSQRVTALTLDLALALGIPDTSLVHIRRGALLHDIGKMAIPDQILLKPGPLDSAEWEVMRQHPVYAYELLVPIPYLRPALDIPYGHHEKWDGSGYPQGLKGEQIPLAARLFAVVDVWDALTSDRPYRSAWTPERALAFIKAEAGAHFDPIVVDTFVQLMRAHGIGVDQVDPFDTLA